MCSANLLYSLNSRSDKGGRAGSALASAAGLSCSSAAWLLFCFWHGSCGGTSAVEDMMLLLFLLAEVVLDKKRDLRRERGTIGDDGSCKMRRLYAAWWW